MALSHQALDAIRQRDAGRLRQGEPAHASASSDRHELLGEVDRLAERLGCANCFVLDDGNYAIERRIGDRWIVVDEVAGRYLYAGVGWVNFHDSTDDDDGWLFPTLDAAWEALDAARASDAEGEGRR